MACVRELLVHNHRHNRCGCSFTFREEHGGADYIQFLPKKNQRSSRREQHSGGFREACKRSCPGVVAPTYLLNRKEVAHGKLQARGRRQRVRVGGGGTAPDWRVRVRVRVWVLGAAKAAVMRQSVRRCNKQTKHQGQGKTHESSHAAFKQPAGRGDDSTGCKKKKKKNNNNNNGRAGAAAAT